MDFLRRWSTRKRKRNACEIFATRVYRDSACSLSQPNLDSHLASPLYPSFGHGWRRWVRHLGRGQASCRTLSASILLVHPPRRSEALVVLSHVPPLRPLPSDLLPSLPPLAGDQLSKVGPFSKDSSRVLSDLSSAAIRATRRRHGIPDTDNRPFNVAYAAAVTARKENEARKTLQLRQRTLEEASPAPSPTRKSFGLDAKHPLTSGKRVSRNATWCHLIPCSLVPGGLGSYPIRSPSVAGRARSSLGSTYGQQCVSFLSQIIGNRTHHYVGVTCTQSTP